MNFSKKVRNEKRKKKKTTKNKYRRSSTGDAQIMLTFNILFHIEKTCEKEKKNSWTYKKVGMAGRDQTNAD